MAEEKKPCKLFHRWKYRNPYDRTCKKCGKQQVVFGIVGTGRFDEWEDVYVPELNATNVYREA